MADNEDGVVMERPNKKRKDAVSTDSEAKPKKAKIALANVKNKLKRQELYKDLKYEKNKEKREKRKRQRKDENWESVCERHQFRNTVKKCSKRKFKEVF